MKIYKNFMKKTINIENTLTYREQASASPQKKRMTRFFIKHQEVHVIL